MTDIASPDVAVKDASKLRVLLRIKRLRSNLRICRSWIESDFKQFEVAIDDVEAKLSAADSQPAFLDFDLDNIEREVAALQVYPAQYRHLKRVWIAACLLLVAAQALLGPYASLLWLGWIKAPVVFNPIYGHVVDYIPLRYVMFGVIVGTALVQTKNRSKIRVDNYALYTTIFNSVFLNIVISATMSYVFLRLVKEQMVILQLFGADFNRLSTLGGPIFLFSLAVSLFSDRYLQKLFTSAVIEIRSKDDDTKGA